MIANEQVKQFEDLITNAESILIVYPKLPAIDILATALGLYQTIVAQGKRVSLASPELPAQNPDFHLENIDKTVTEVGNQNLVVSFDYTEEAIDKVSYHIGEDTKKFYLTIKPRSGYPPLSTDNVDFSYTGVDADVVILVGVSSLADLDHLYYGYEDIYERAPLINIQSNPGRSGIVEIASQYGESVSECVAQYVLASQVETNREAATSFLRGIEYSTDYFSSLHTTADTFETVANLMRAGAERSKPIHKSSQTEKQRESRSNGVELNATKDIQVKAKKEVKPQQPGSLKYNPSNSTPRGG